MLIKINLSSRPFYNRFFSFMLHLVIIVVAIIFCIFNGVYLFDYLVESSSLRTKIAQYKSEMQKVEQNINSTIQQIERIKVKKRSKEIIFSNSLINQRMFSWSGMLNNLEKLLPPQVMMLSISPKMLEGKTKIELSVASYYYEEILLFIKNLEESTHFSSIYPLREMNEQDETGMISFHIEVVYHPKK